jgi:hypothetical protein
MQDEKRHEGDRDHDPKTQVNPAARHDSDRTPPDDEARRREGEQVPPVQEEPLDPLGPGGIGD